MKCPLVLLGLIVFSSAFSQETSKEICQQRIMDLSAKIAQEPTNSAFYYSRADVYDVLNDFEKSNQDYIKVVELYRSNPDSKYSGEFAKSCYRLADEYFFRQDKPDKALQYAEEGLQINPGLKDLEILEAILLGLNPGKHEVAAERFNAVSKKYPDDIRLNLYYARFLQENDPLAAAALYEKVTDKDPVNKEALLALGTIYNNEATKLSEEKKEPLKIFDLAKKASLCFERLYKMNPENKELVNILLRLYDELDQQEKADLLKKPY